MTTLALHTPPSAAVGSQVGPRLWRKQILRKGTINYDGRPIRFDDAYIADLRRAFEEGAFDQVPIQFADDRNTHTEDPERTRGQVVGLEETPDGLDALVSLSEAGEQTVRENPGLAVSARIVEDLNRVDGKRWPRAVAHVLATINPRLTGMRPWAQVTLANPELPVVDLTAATYQKGGRMADLTDEQVAGLLALLDNPSPTGDTPTEGEGDELTDAEWEALLAEATAEEEPGEGSPAPGSQPVPALAGAALSAEAQAAINLANANATQAAQTAAALRADVARQSWANQAQVYIQEGCMPVLVELAGKVISPPIDLANGTIDPVAVVREMVEATRGYIDFGVIGSTATVSPDDEAAAMADAWLDNFGGK